MTRRYESFPSLGRWSSSSRRPGRPGERERWKVEAADRLVRAVMADIGLEVAEARSGIVKVRDGFEVLGFTFQGRFLRPRPRALSRFKDEVRRRTRRPAPVPLRQMIEDLDHLSRGWGNYFRAGDARRSSGISTAGYGCGCGRR